MVYIVLLQLFTTPPGHLQLQADKAQMEQVIFSPELWAVAEAGRLTLIADARTVIPLTQVSSVLCAQNLFLRMKWIYTL
ncbi:hypothetical protein scyTo_0009386 [Scyliorhinus torazame]|uniref:Uncharacterized protein n=1 Tax=Scyliorhinus torazame TaxID=75743 RepID=A0A401NLE0_SCYTO|nr:hypothetical protein [Scyliorhinus torazame]